MRLARGHAKLIKQPLQADQSVAIDPRHISADNARTSSLVEHPAGHTDAKLRFLALRVGLKRLDQHDHGRLIPIANPPEHRHLSVKEWVKTISDHRRTKLAGSVWMHCGTHSPRSVRRAVITRQLRQSWGTFPALVI